EHSGNTPGAETLIILNGPLIRELGFNYEQGALRDGIQANTTIGRFWRLYLRNVAGFLHHRTDKGTFGNTWRVVLAENEDVLRRIGWATGAEDEGVSGGNAVTISRYTGGGVIASVFGNTPDRMLPYLADSVARKVGWERMFTVGWGAGSQRPLLVLSPILAETLAKGGIDKATLRQRLFELARIPAWQFERYVGEWTNLVPGRPTLTGLVKAGTIPAVFAASDDPDRLGPTVCGGGGLVGGWTNLVPGRPTLTGLVKAGTIPAVFAASDDPDRLVPIVCRAEDLMVAGRGDPLRPKALAS